MYRKIYKVLLPIVLLSILVSCSHNKDDDKEDKPNSEYLLTSKLDPGFGKAVYFTGDFDEASDWHYALRGEYCEDDDGYWYLMIPQSRTFKYKCLVGDYSNGELVYSASRNFYDDTNLQWEDDGADQIAVKLN